MVESNSNEISLSDVLSVLRRHRRALCITPAILVLCSIVYLHLAEPKYTVTLKVTPTSSATSALPSNLTSLAGLTGIALPTGDDTIDFELYLEGLKSRETSAAVTLNIELLQQLFAEHWDAEAGEWGKPGGFLAGLAGLVKGILGFPSESWRPPDAKAVNEFLDDELRIVRDRSGPVVTIMIEHGRPEVAQALLSVLHEVVDSALRQKELDRTNAYVAYLREQLANVSVTEYRQALHDILAEQEKRRMVASSNLPFAAEPFGAPTVSVKATSPRPLLLILTSLVLGIVLGVAFALSLHQADRRARLAT